MEEQRQGGQPPAEPGEPQPVAAPPGRPTHRHHAAAAAAGSHRQEQQAAEDGRSSFGSRQRPASAAAYRGSPEASDPCPPPAASSPPPSAPSSPPPPAPAPSPAAAPPPAAPAAGRPVHAAASEAGRHRLAPAQPLGRGEARQAEGPPPRVHDRAAQEAQAPRRSVRHLRRWWWEGEGGLSTH